MADVICPNCGDRYHETTDAYRPGVTTTGNMLRLKKTYVDNGWSSFPEYESTSFGDMDCPGCGGLYSDNGRVRIDEEQYDKEPKPVEVRLETAEDVMQRLMDEYEPELPEYHVQIEQDFFDSFKNGVYHKDGPFDAAGSRKQRKQGRQRR